jgi:hypothetical protein
MIATSVWGGGDLRRREWVADIHNVSAAVLLMCLSGPRRFYFLVSSF